MVLDRLKRDKPRLAIVSYPCTYWSKLADTNYRTKQEKRRLAKLRKEDEPFLEFCEQVFDVQLRNGDDALGENPLTSQSFRRPPIQRILNHPEVHAGVSHGCRFNLRNKSNGLLLKKPTLWFSTSLEICEELSKRCPNTQKHLVHQHGECQGGANAREAGRYTKEMAQAIHKGFVRVLRRKEPSRILSLVRGIKKKLGSEGRLELGWSEKSLERVLKDPNSVFVQESSNADSQMTVPDSDQVAEIGDFGVTFEVPSGRRLDKPLRKALAKVHSNLGHPSIPDLQRFLRGAGASQEMLEACNWLRCSTCASTSRTRTHRTVRIPPHDIQFNDQIMVDCFHLRDADGVGHWFMSMLDRATMYHLVANIPDHSPETFIRVFRSNWTNWAGYPGEVSIDLERGFGSVEFARSLGEANISVAPIASQAHWQHGKVERHGSTIKDMLSRVIKESDIKDPKHLMWAAEEVTHAKNMLVREHGFSPAQLLFGKEPRCFGEIEANGSSCAYHFSVGDRGSQVAKRMKMRHDARLEYIKCQSKLMLQQTARNKTRPWKEPAIGDKCFFYHEFRKKGVGIVKGWHGPALVIGLQGQSNIWIVFGGKCYLVAQEHCREAVGEEHMYGQPEVQEALAIFKGTGRRNVTYLDITSQKHPSSESLDHPVEDAVIDSDDEMIPDEQYRIGVHRFSKIPDDLLNVCKQPGWTENNLGEPVHVGYKVYALKIPGGNLDVSKWVLRTTWGLSMGQWRLLEDEVRWTVLDDPQEIIPNGPMDILITVFGSRTRRQACLDDVPVSVKRQRADVYVCTSKRKQEKALDKEIPFSMIPDAHREQYKLAEAKEWQSWLDYQATEALSIEDSKSVLEQMPKRVLKSRFVYRNKNAGLVDDHGNQLPVRAKARLCVQGQHDPDCMSGEVKLDAPTIQHATFLTFLHCVVSFGWVNHWRNGDVSSAFLQGEPSKGEPLYMFQPARGLPGLNEGQILKLCRPVYGRPDAPRAWYEAISGFIMKEMQFERSILDPALFIHRDVDRNPDAMLILHVDDLMVATDGSQQVEKMVQLLVDRFPFGEWSLVKDNKSGVTYCGKEVLVDKDDKGERVIRMRQKGFVDGRLDTVPIDPDRRKTPAASVSPEEQGNFRSVLGSLQWLATQSRPDVGFLVNQLQKRVNCLTVGDLEVANKVVRIVKKHDVTLCFRNLGRNVAVVSFHDAGLYNSIGVEVEDDNHDYLQSLADKRLLYSQKGCMVGFCRREDLNETREIACNMVAWKTKTNKRIIESSFAAETHAAIMGHGCGHYQRTLLLEIYHGKHVVLDSERVAWEELMPLRMITDCKSVYDTVNKDGQSVGDRSNAINVAVLRQLCVISSPPTGERAKMMWVPTRHQVADPLTKSGRHKDLHGVLETGKITLHGCSAKQRLKPKRDFRQCESGIKSSS